MYIQVRNTTMLNISQIASTEWHNFWFLCGCDCTCLCVYHLTDIKQFTVRTNKCTIYIYIYIYIYISNVPYTASSLITPAHSNHQPRHHTYYTVRTVLTATKLTTSMNCNYNIWQFTAFYRPCCTVNCEHFNVLISFSLYPLMIFITLAN